MHLSLTGQEPFVLGRIEKIKSGILGEERTINIYLPDGYRAADSNLYPVIYLLDGSADEDFIHIVGLVQFNSFPWVNALKKSIVVGIANIDRRRDFTFPSKIAVHRQTWPTTGGSDKFIGFIATELQPFIESHYKTTKEKTIIGQSLGGLLATEILLKQPMLFNRYVIVSPSLWWDDGSLLNVTMKSPPAKNTLVYIAAGKEGRTPAPTHRIMEADAKELANKLSKYKEMLVKFDYLPGVNHGNILHQAVQNAIGYFSKTAQPN
jgi:predicted alpha/beta superfamily hydrolase